MHEPLLDVEAGIPDGPIESDEPPLVVPLSAVEDLRASLSAGSPAGLPPKPARPSRWKPLLSKLRKRSGDHPPLKPSRPSEPRWKAALRKLTKPRPPHDPSMNQFVVPDSHYLYSEKGSFPSLLPLEGFLWLLALGSVGPVWLVLMCTVLKSYLVDWHLVPTRPDCPDGEETSCAVRTFLEMLSVPLLCLGFTYVHIWIALWMMFYPIDYVGCMQFPGIRCLGIGQQNFGLGWQGLAPHKWPAILSRTVRLVMAHVLSMCKVMSRLDADGLARALGDETLDAMAERTVAAAWASAAPRVYARMPAAVKARLVAEARAKVPAIVAAILRDLQEEAESLLNLEKMAMRIFTPQPQLVIAMFVTVAFDDLKFIRNAGAVIGLLFGFVQLGVFSVYRSDWVLPVFGAAIGSFTNWLAIQLLFRPVHPIKCGCCTLHGVFMRKRPQAAAALARALNSTTSNARQLLYEITRGSGAARFREIAVARTLEALDAAMSEERGAGQGVARWVLVKAAASAQAVANPRRSLRAVGRALSGGSQHASSPSLGDDEHHDDGEEDRRIAVGGAGSTVRGDEQSAARARQREASGMEKTSSETSSSEVSTRTPIATAAAAAASAEDEGGGGSLDFGGWWKQGRRAAAEAVADALPGAMTTAQCEAYVDDALQLEATIREKVSVLDYELFEELFHGIFAEDEWKLFAVGGLMGAVVGFGQNYLLHM